MQAPLTTATDVEVDGGVTITYVGDDTYRALVTVEGTPAAPTVTVTAAPDPNVIPKEGATWGVQGRAGKVGRRGEGMMMGVGVGGLAAMFGGALDL